MKKEYDETSVVYIRQSAFLGMPNALLTSAALVLFVLFFGICAIAVETEDEALLTSLDAARESWLQNVSFYGNYTFKQTGFYSETEANTTDIEDRYIVAKGVICKLGDKYRLQAFYVEKPEVVNSSGAVSKRSIDTIANKNFHAHFYPEQGVDFPASGSLNKRGTNTVSNVVSHLQTFQTPFVFFLNPIAEISSSISMEQKYGLMNLEGGRILLSFEGKSANGSRHIKEVTIRTNEKIPVVEKITQHRFGNEGSNKPLSSSTKKVLEWKMCDGMNVPSRIRAVSGSHKPVSGEDVWIVSEWRSDDLGNRSPTEKDFVLQLPPDVGLVGMNHYPMGGLFDIGKITDEDFLESGSPYFEQETWGAVELAPSRYVALRLTLTILGAVLILWGLVQMYRKGKKS